jgi:hypothetical protein
MKSSAVFSPLTALTLKIVGVIMILSSLLDFIILAIPTPGVNPLTPEWQVGFTTQLVDRGIIPLVGIALLVAGYWVSNSSGIPSAEPRSSFLDLRFWAFILSSLLGLVFLLLVPVLFINVNKQSADAIKQIEQKANAAEVQLDTQTKQVNALVKDPQKLSELDRAIASGQVQGEQLARLQALKQQLNTFKQDPKALNQQVEEAQTKLRSERLKAENQAKTGALKLSLRTGLSSLLLAIGYIAIGWTGLRSLGGSPASSRKA